MTLPLRSFKLQFREGYARIVPAQDAAGCPFSGPGASVRGPRAMALVAAAMPLVRALERFEPGIEVRSLSVDLERQRLLATLEPLTPEADPRGRVVRLDGGTFALVWAEAGGLAEALAEVAADVLAARS